VKTENSNEKIARTVCAMCYGGCGVLAYVKEGIVIKIGGDPEHPNNRGELCPKGKAGIEILYHPNRLNYPLKRIGTRSEGNWQRISWDEALDTISQKLTEFTKKYGPECVCINSGSPLSWNMGIRSYFAYLLGTPNTSDPGNICFLPAALAVRATIGYSVAALATEVVGDEVLNSKCILLWAANPRESMPHPVGEGIFKVIGKGTKLIVVDPRPTDYAKAADIWLRPRPATDDALALGMIHVIIDGGLYDKEFINKWTYGFDELKKHVQQYPPEKVSKITWIPEKDIVAAAKMFAQTRPSSICQRVPIDQSLNAVQTSRAIFILRAVCGNDFDQKGGNPFPAEKPIIGEFPQMKMTRKLSREVKEKLIGAKELPLMSGPDADFAFVHPSLLAKAMATGEPYKIRGLITTGHNAMLSDPDTRLIERGLRNVDFSVGMDLFMTPSLELYDMVLPAACWLERDGVRGHPAYPWVTPIAHTVVGPLYERWDDIKFFIELAKRMKLDIPWQNIEEYYNERVKPAGITFKDLDGVNYIPRQKEYDRLRKGTFSFLTPSKKLEVYSTLLEEYGYDPLPHHKPPLETSSEFPLILMGGGRKVGYTHSSLRQIRSLRDLAPEPVVEISSESAGNLDISEGDWVFVETPYKKNEPVRFRARILKGLSPNLIVTDSQWWYPERETPDHGCFESNINMIIPGDLYDPIYGSTNIRSIPCRIYREEQSNL
jgi:anaerobic selenocysteine-containing dehydrogenase